MDGERALRKWMQYNYLILRVSWSYGIYGNNFIQKVFDKLRNNEKLTIVNDQIGRPTSTLLISKIIHQYIANKVPDGIYNLSNIGEPISKYELAQFINETFNFKG